VLDPTHPLAKVCNPGRGRYVAVLAILAVVAVPAAAAQGPAVRPVPDRPAGLEPLIGTPRPGIQPLTRPRAAGAGLDDPRPLSLHITRPTPVRTVLQLLFRGTAVSVIVPDSLPVTFSGQLRGVTLRQALDAVLAGSGYGYAVHGTAVRVVPRVHAQEGRR
jgi:hypothetical protein